MTLENRILAEELSLEMLIDRMVSENYVRVAKDSVSLDVCKTMLSGGYILYDLADFFGVSDKYYYFIPHKLYKYAVEE